MNRNIVKHYGIFTTNQEYADYLINDIANTIYSKRRIYYKTKQDVILELENGYKFVWINPTNEGKIRGKRVHSAYIDVNTCNIDILYKIKSCTCVYVEKYDFYIVDSRNFYNDNTAYDLNTLIDRLKKIRFLKGNISNVYFEDSEFGNNEINRIFVDNDMLSLYKI